MLDINFINPKGGIVKSVNGLTGRVVLTAEDIGAMPADTEIPSLDGYATEDYVREQIADIPAPNLSAYATKTYVNNAIDNIPETDLSNYATKTYVNNAVADVEVDMSGYATEEYVAKEIAKAQLEESEVDLSAYYTKSETDNAIKTAVDAIDIPETDLSNYYNKGEVDALVENVEVDLTGYATEEYVGTKIAEAKLDGSEVDLSGYYTKSETDSAISTAIGAIEIPEEPDLSGYALKTELPTVPTNVSAFTNDSGYVNATYVATAIEQAQLGEGEVDLTDYYTKTEVDGLIPDLEGYATESYVDEAISNIDIPTGGGGSVAVDDSTIIQNDDGTISTAIGGYKTIIEEKVVLEANGNFVSNGEIAVINAATTNELSTLSSGIICTVVINDTTIESCIADVNSNRVYISVDNDMVSYVKYKFSDGKTTVGTNSELTITNVTVTQNAGCFYSPIDSNFIRTGRGLYIENSEIVVNENWINEMIASYLEDNIQSAEGGSY